MSGLSSKIQIHFKNSSGSLLLFGFRVITGGMLGLSFALIGDELVNYGLFMFLFVITAIALSFLRISRHWSAVSVFVFNLICVLLGMLLRLYIVVAPGA